MMGCAAIHCRNRLQSLQRARATAEDEVSPSASELSSGPENSPSPSPSNFSIPSSPPSSGPLTPSLLGEPTRGNSSRVYNGEPDSQFNLEFPSATRHPESFQMSPEVLQHGFPITISASTDDPTGCWQGAIPPSELWKGCPPGNSIVGENVQFYQPSQVLTAQVDPTHTFDNTSPQPSIPFTMTCPVPHCCYQCQTVVEIWRHITWAHVRPQPDDGIEGIVEKVVLGNV